MLVRLAKAVSLLHGRVHDMGGILAMGPEGLLLLLKEQLRKDRGQDVGGGQSLEQSKLSVGKACASLVLVSSC